jgi:O-antigen/teichoic acid export membrane protein
LRDTYRQLFHHSAVYGIGHLLFRASSIVLLPVYTRYLRPADYAVIALLDVSTGLLGIMIGSGIAPALTRHHFDDDDYDYRRALWWTGLVFVALTATLVVVPAWFLRDLLSDAILGPQILRGELYLTLALPQVWLGAVGQIANTFLRVSKWSGLYVSLALARLVVNIGLNLFLLIEAGMGPGAILLGNLIAGILHTATVVAILAAAVGPLRADAKLAVDLWEFGRPLIITALLALLMHNGDRYLLRLFVSMEAIGVYSIAYVVGQGVSTMIMTSFSAIWNVSIYEIAREPDGPAIFGDVFRRFFHAVALLMFGVSLLAEPLLRLLVAPEYLGAADLLPVICLGYLFFALHDHFRVPVLLAKRTPLMLPVFLLGVALNVAANLLLDPWFGVQGAAWSTLITFAGFSSFAWWRYRKLARYPYPLASCGTVLAGVIVSYLGYRVSCGVFELGLTARLVAASLLWVAWASLLFGKPARTLLYEIASNRAMP